MCSKLELSIISGSSREYEKKLLHRIFEENVISKSYRDIHAVIFNNDIGNSFTLTYIQLNNATNQIAAILIDEINTRQLKPNQDGDWIVAVCMPPSTDLIITLLAILKAGAAYLPIDPTFPKNRIEHILQEAEPAFVIYDDKSAESSLFDNSTVVLSFAECKTLSTNYKCENISNDQMLQSANNNRLALVLYTSGSTGVPKGVRIPHEVVMNRLQWQWETFPYSATEQTCVFKTAFTFVDSISEIWSPLLMKKTLLVVPKSITKDPAKLVTMLQKHKIERLVLVPTLLRSILIYLSMDKGICQLPKLKLWVCSGETLPVSLANEFYNYFPENEYSLCNFYGSTEIMGDATYFECRGKEQLRNHTNVPIGKPIFNTRIHILNANRKPVEIGETGELFVSGANLAHSYVNGQDSQRFIENIISKDPIHSRLYQTGDYGFLQEGGIIQYEDRTDSQIKIRGHRVDLSEIQKHLLEIDDVEKAIVLCYRAGQLDEVILAFARIKSTPKMNASQIEKNLRNKLPEYMVPQVFLIDEIPLLVNGKIDRQSLLKMYENSIESENSTIEYDYGDVLENEMKKAQILFETVSEMIERSSRASISLKDNFFDLGGNSLNSIYTIAKLHDKGYRIEITDFLSARSLKEILIGLKEIDKNDEESIGSIDNESSFIVEPLKMEHRSEVVHIIAKSFSEKAILFRYLKTPPTYSDSFNFTMARFGYFVEQESSFILRDKMNRIVGVSLNHDMKSEPADHNDTIAEFLNAIEEPVINQLPKDKLILDAFLMATHESLNSQENIMIVTCMEAEVIRVAKERNCYGIISTNISPLTQQLADEVFGYENMRDCQVNQYISSKGDKPFASAPDSCKVSVNWKKL